MSLGTTQSSPGRGLGPLGTIGEGRASPGRGRVWREAGPSSPGPLRPCPRRPPASPAHPRGPFALPSPPAGPWRPLLSRRVSSCHPAPALGLDSERPAARPGPWGPAAPSRIVGRPSRPREAPGSECGLGPPERRSFVKTLSREVHLLGGTPPLPSSGSCESSSRSGRLAARPTRSITLKNQTSLCGCPIEYSPLCRNDCRKATPFFVFLTEKSRVETTGRHFAIFHLGRGRWRGQPDNARRPVPNFTWTAIAFFFFLGYVAWHLY